MNHIQIPIPRQYKYTSTKEYHDAFPCAIDSGEPTVTVT